VGEDVAQPIRRGVVVDDLDHGGASLPDRQGPARVLLDHLGELAVEVAQEAGERGAIDRAGEQVVVVTEEREREQGPGRAGRVRAVRNRRLSVLGREEPPTVLLVIHQRLIRINLGRLAIPPQPRANPSLDLPPSRRLRPFVRTPSGRAPDIA
jgi:hypothetical protein